MKRRGLSCFLSIRGGGRGHFLHLVLVSSSRQGDRGETGLGSGIRDRVDCRVDGGAFRYRDRRRRCGQGGSREFHLRKYKIKQNGRIELERKQLDLI